MNQEEYLRWSFELHLFFDRIMKEHSLFLEASFTDKDREFKRTASQFQKMFANILENIIPLANGNVRPEFLAAGEMVTEHTLQAEEITANLSGILINTNITQKENNLRSGRIQVTDQLLRDISAINQQTLAAVRNLIQFKEDVLNRVLSCQMYTTNYPLLIHHIMREAEMYHSLLSKVERKERLDENYLYEQELFWNTIMKEHAQFIRGLLDPSEDQLILASDRYANDYQMILKNYQNNPVLLTNASLTETISFRDFKIAGEEGILNCKIKSIIIPLLSDHVVREANHFLRILRSAK